MRIRIGILWGFGFAFSLFLFLPHSVRVPMIWGFVAVETAHAMAPIVLMWMTPSLREVALARPEQFIALPVLSVVLALALPFSWVFTGFVIGNAWHFGMQNFGVVRLLGMRRWRWATMAAFVGISCAITWIVPRVASRDVAMLVTVAHSVNHWTTDLGLTCIAAKHGFALIGALLVAGCVGFCWYQLTPGGAHKAGEAGIRVAYALGFVHFLYSRWVWQRGRELLSATHGECDLMVESSIRIAR